VFCQNLSGRPKVPIVLLDVALETLRRSVV